MKEWVSQLLDILKTHDQPSLWLEEQRANGNLKKYFPELEACYGVKQNQYHKYDVYHHLIYSCDAAVKRLDIRLAALMHDIGKPVCKKKIQDGDWVFYNHEIVSTDIAYQTLKRWDVEWPLVRKVTLLIRYHMFHYQDEWSDSAVRRLIRKVGEDNLEDLFLLRVADREGNGYRSGEPAKITDLRGHIKKILDEEKRFKVTDLKISGKDLMALGMKPGPQMGELLKTLFEKVDAGEIPNEREVLLKEAEKLVKETLTEV
jgi:poly(A) polymerase/tRNA nucleotidyltransferase (CCA-adding enzyme)